MFSDPGFWYSSIKAASDIAKIVRESGLTLEQAEYKLKLAELVEKLADAKMEIASVQDVIDEKDQRIKQLEQEAEIRGQLTYESPYYWLQHEGRRDGPFCQQCYDSEKKLMRLTGYGNGYWDCKTCKSNYTDSSYRMEIAVVSSRTDFDSF